MDNILGERITMFREREGISQEELANKVRKITGKKTTQTTVSKWETGLQSPTVTTLQAIAKIFGVTIDDINDGARSVDLCIKQGTLINAIKKKTGKELNLWIDFMNLTNVHLNHTSK